MGTRKRANQFEEPQVVAEQELQVEVQPEAEVPSSAEEVEPQAEVFEVAEQPKLRRCPSHHRWFSDEDEMRPLDEYRYHKTTGKMLTTYCKRCQSKIHAEYARERRKDSPAKADELAELRQQLVDKEAQLVDAEERVAYLEAEVARLEALLNDAAPEQD